MHNNRIVIHHIIKIGEEYINNIDISYKPTQEEMDRGELGRPYIRELKLSPIRDKAKEWEIKDSLYEMHPYRDVMSEEESFKQVVEVLDSLLFPYHIIKRTTVTSVEEEVEEVVVTKDYKWKTILHTREKVLSSEQTKELKEISEKFYEKINEKPKGSR